MILLSKTKKPTLGRYVEWALETFENKARTGGLTKVLGIS
jgi:hypothetical protein